MSYRKKVEKKLKRKEKSYEIKQLMKEKRGEEYEVLEARAQDNRGVYFKILRYY